MLAPRPEPAPRRLPAWGALILLTWGEVRVLGRLFYAVPADRAFVLESVRGVLAGTPVFESWQHRILAPWLIHALAGWMGGPLEALEACLAATTLAANTLLYGIARGRGAGPGPALLLVGAFALVRILSAFRLEYPWDQLDAVLFVGFGGWVAAGRGLAPLVPLVLAFALNHETILYVPLWYLLQAAVPAEGAGGTRLLGAARPRAGRLRTAALALGVAAVATALVVLLRRQLYVGRPALPGQEFEPSTPVIVNPTHVFHNLERLLTGIWSPDRAFVSVTLLASLVVLVRLAVRRTHVTAALFSLIVLGTVIAFGYVNETRHYVPLLAFWFGYAGPGRAATSA